MKKTLNGLKRKVVDNVYVDLRRWKTQHGHRLVRIWSDEWRCYWRPSRAGYTTDVAQAGIYRLDDALDASGHCGREKKIAYEFLPKNTKLTPTQESAGDPQLMLKLVSRDAQSEDRS